MDDPQEEAELAAEQDAELAAEVDPQDDPDAAAAVEARKRIRKPKPHERKRPPKETPAAAAAYIRYREMPPTLRSLRTLSALMVDDEVKSGQPLRTDRDRRVRNLSNQLFEWSSLYGWQHRVMEWDAEQAEHKRLEREGAMDAMNANQALLSEVLQARVWQNVADMLDADHEALLRYRTQVLAVPAGAARLPKHPSLFFGPHALVNLGKILIDTERIARGAATAAVQQQHTGQVEMTIAVKRAQTNLAAVQDAMAGTPMEQEAPQFPFASNIALAGEGREAAGADAGAQTVEGVVVAEAEAEAVTPAGGHPLPFAGLLPPAANE